VAVEEGAIPRAVLVAHRLVALEEAVVATVHPLVQTRVLAVAVEAVLAEVVTVAMVVRESV